MKKLFISIRSYVNRYAILKSQYNELHERVEKLEESVKDLHPEHLEKLSECYKGKKVGLAEMVEDRKLEYSGEPEWMWEDEGIIYAIQEYYGSKGCFSDDDIAWLHANGFSEEDFID